MQIRRILLTGDDGYQALGTRLLAQLLRNEYELFILGTHTQQSGVGGKVSLATGFDWQETEVDGIPALCIDGTPADGTELAAAYFSQPFDLAISGVNWGANLGSAVFGSGTVNAALRCLGVGVAKKALAISWDLPPEFYLHDHTKNPDLTEYLAHPGETLRALLPTVFAADFWGADLLNINLPQQPTTNMKMTKMVRDAREVYNYDVYKVVPGSAKAKPLHFAFCDSRRYNAKLDADLDVMAITNSCISVSPCKYDILNETLYEQHRRTPIVLTKSTPAEPVLTKSALPDTTKT